MDTVGACFEFNGVDAPILKAIKTPAKALAWRDENLFERFILLFRVDAEPAVLPPADLFEWAEQQKGS